MTHEPIDYVKTEGGTWVPRMQTRGVVEKIDRHKVTISIPVEAYYRTGDRLMPGDVAEINWVTGVAHQVGEDA